MEKKEFNDQYTLIQFFKKELPELLKHEFPCLDFAVSEKTPLPELIYIYPYETTEISFLSKIMVDGEKLLDSEMRWKPLSNVAVFDIVRTLIRRDPKLSFVLAEARIKALEERIMGAITELSFSPGGPGYEEAKRDFEKHCEI